MNLCLSTCLGNANLFKNLWTKPPPLGSKGEKKVWHRKDTGRMQNEDLLLLLCKTSCIAAELALQQRQREMLHRLGWYNLRGGGCISTFTAEERVVLHWICLRDWTARKLHVCKDEMLPSNWWCCPWLHQKVWSVVRVCRYSEALNTHCILCTPSLDTR